MSSVLIGNRTQITKLQNKKTFVIKNGKMRHLRRAHKNITNIYTFTNIQTD